MEPIITAKYTKDFKSVTIKFFDGGMCEFVVVGEVEDSEVEFLASLEGAEAEGWSSTIY